MQAREHERHEETGHLTVPRWTTPTWEIELLMSAGLVFALFQVPAPLHEWTRLASARLGNAGDMLVSMGLAYGLMAVYALIGMFLIHLTARAYWVALVGIHSVYPDGIRWEKFSGGPISRAEMQRQIPSMPALIERADNTASLCFAFGLVVVMSSVLGAAVAMPAVGLAIVLSQWLFDGAHLTTLMMGLMALVLVPMVGVGVLDKQLGKRRPPSAPVPSGPLARAVTFFLRLPLNRLPGPLIQMLATNQRGHRAYVLFFAAMLTMMALLFADVALRRGGMPFDSYDYLPADPAGTADPRHYREFRNTATDHWREPSIDAMVADGDWLRLIVPYDPERHGVLVERRCVEGRAGAEALAARLAQDPPDRARRDAERRVLDCLARELDVRIDGEAVAGTDHAFTRDPGTGLRGLLVMVPLRTLAPGRHELQLLNAGDQDSWNDPDARAGHEADGPVRIPFWR